jgi:hypothetical protein
MDSGMRRRVGLVSLGGLGLVLAAGAFGRVAAQPPAGLFEPVAQLGGEARAMTLRGDRLLIASGTGVAEWDVSDPAKPYRLPGAAVGRGPIEALVAHGAAVVGFSGPWPTASTITVMAAQEGADWRWIGEQVAPLGARRPAIDKTLLLFHDGRRLCRFGIADPPGLQPEATLDLGNGLQGIATRGGRALVATGTGLAIVETGRPGLALLGRLEVPERERYSGEAVLDVAFDGRHAVLVGRGSERRPPPSPTATPRQSPTPYPPGVPTPTPTAAPTGGPYLRVVDVADLRGPKQVGEIRGEAWDGWTAYGGVTLDADRRLAYVLGSSGSLRVVDYADPAVPVVRSEIPSIAGLPRDGPVVVPGHVLVLEQGSLLRALDVRTPAAPREAGRTYLPTWQVSDILGGGTLALAVEGLRAHLLDLSDRANPRELGTLPAHDLRGLALDGDERVWLLDGRDLVTLDLREPASPREVDRQRILSASARFVYSPGRLARSGELLLVAGGEDGLLVMDLADPDRPRLVGRRGACQQALAVAGIDAATVVARCEGGTLELLDVRDPAAPTLLSTVTGISSRLLARDGFLYVVESRLQVLDVRDPARPQWREEAFLDGPYTDAELAGDVIFAAGTAVDVLDLSVPGSPIRVARVPVPSLDPELPSLTAIGRVGDDLLVGVPGGAGLTVLVKRRLLPRVTPVTPTTSPTPSRTPSPTGFPSADWVLLPSVHRR